MSTKDFKKGIMLNSMLVLATNSHSGQFDKGGNPYILHPLKVMYLLKTSDEELMCIALGHDIIEDCDVTYRQLTDLGFTDRIINGIRCLTKVPGETQAEYMEKVKSNEDAIKVKLCDLRHNMDLRRLKGTSEKDLARMNKYTRMYAELNSIQS